MRYKVTLNNKVYEVEVEETSAMLVDEYEALAPVAPAAPVAAAPVLPPLPLPLPQLPPLWPLLPVSRSPHPCPAPS